MKAALIAQNVAAGVTAVAGVAASVVNAQTGAVRAPKVSAVSAANVVSVIHAARANVANVQNAVRVQSVQLKKVPSARIAGRDKTVVRARNVASAQSRENRASRVSRVSPANRVKIAVSARSSNNARKAMPISSKMFRIVESAQVVKVNDAVAAGAATGVNAESVLSAAMRASRSKTHSLMLPRKPIPANAHL